MARRAPAAPPPEAPPGAWPQDGRWHYRRSLASRVAVLTSLVVAASITIMTLTAYFVMRTQMQSQLDTSLLLRANRASTFTALSEVTAQRVPPWMLGAADVRVMFITTDLGVLTADNVPTFELGRPELKVAAGESDKSIRTLTTESNERYRVAAVPAGHGQALVLAQPLAPTERTLDKLGTVLFTFGGAGVLASLLAGWAVAANGLRPVRRLTAQVEQIAQTEDLTPLHVEGDDEVARLATAFNQMLLALGASRDRQRRLVADASHELRTPLTSLRTNLDLLRQAEGNEQFDAESRLELLDDVRAQIEELSALVGDLVELARDEAPESVITEVDLARVVERALARVRRRAPGIEFAVDLEPWVVEGDASSLERALTNLLDNAAKWSPDDATITVSLVEGVLTIDDQGPGIDPADRPHVFDRFYRSEESRAMPGSGLGLAIVRQVVDRHGGQVVVGEAPGGGARFSLWVPGVGR
jgi:two-component system sensor histidine kinase MprB